LTFLDVCQNRGRYYLELVSDLGLTNLEIVYLFKDISAVAAALVHKTITRE
jgi:hypothetical protein